MSENVQAAPPLGRRWLGMGARPPRSAQAREGAA